MPNIQKKLFGGLAVRNKKGPLWKFNESNDGSFTLKDPDYITGLYFPLFNLAGMKASVTPELKGDVCLNFHQFLTIPQVTEDFHLSKANRNFWIYIQGQEPWSITGTSAFQTAKKWNRPEPAQIEAGFGWFKTLRTHSKAGLQTSATVFVPSDDESVEIMLVEIENISKKSVTFTATSASPLFGRGAENLRDHRQVTSMFNEVIKHPFGVMVKPRIVHDEKGHQASHTIYTTLACDAQGKKPKKIWSNEIEFIGEGGSLDNPEAVYLNNNGTSVSPALQNGVEAVAAMRFSALTLKPKQKTSYIVLRGITENSEKLNHWLKNIGSLTKAQTALEKTKNFWKKISDALHFETGQPDQDQLLRWIAFQPFCRKVYGNSYLPDHDYGRGGRGWRDLWSDLAALFLVDPSGTRDEIINSLHGVRIDGTNATLIGTKAGEFSADRNNIVRTWCDHGVWPFFILHFYVNQTGDYEILNKEITYWKDKIIGRGKMRDSEWNDSQGFAQKNKNQEIYKGSIFEHALLQQLSCFFNVGEHNNLLLEGADWNDTYDMAKDKGESVCFYNWIAWNLKLIADLCDEFTQKSILEIPLLTEILILLDRLPHQKKLDYNSPKQKQERLAEYFTAIQHAVSGNKINISCSDLAKDLREKSEFIYQHIRKNEYVKTQDQQQFFNGHYDNHARRIHGDHPNGVRMDLTSQVMPIMCETATDTQIQETFESITKYLHNPKTGGLRLSTDLKELKLDFGRVSGFIYGWRENGSIWSQQNAMLIYGLYRRNFVKEGYQVYQELLDLCLNSAQSKIFPNLPSCFRLDGKGLSCYLTGSATWLILALVTQIFGVRGEQGNLVIHPKLVQKQFGKKQTLSIHCNFLERPLKINFNNPKKLDWGKYKIVSIQINKKTITELKPPAQSITIKKENFLKCCNKQNNTIEVLLG